MSLRRRLSCVTYGRCAALALALWPALASAQAGLGQLVPQGSPIPRVLPRRPAGVAPGTPAGQAAPPGQVPAMAVTIKQVSVEGATAYPAAQLAALTGGLTGPAVPLARVEAARTAILNLYRRDGYALTTVTARLEAGGTLVFAVVEGRITAVKLDGDIGPAGTQVLRFLDHLTKERPIASATLERWLLLANDVPGVTVRAVLRPSTSDPGALTLVAQVSRHAFNGLLTADNRAFRLTGPTEALLVLDANSFTQFGERTEASLYHTEGNTQDFGQASTEFFIGASGLKLRLYGGYGEATPSGFLAAIGYHGFTTVGGASLSYPLIRSRQQTLNLSAFFDVIDTRITAITSASGAATQQGEDNLRVARLGADYALDDEWLGRSAINLANLRVSQGLPFLGGTPDRSLSASRPNEKTSFTKFAFELDRTQTLFSPWHGATVALKGLITGQASGDVLPPAEKFFLGGAEFDRGFYSGEATGDSALAWTAELQLNDSYDLALFSTPVPVAARYYAFYDRGEAWQNQRIDPDMRLSSEGIGVRLGVTRFTEFDLEGVIRNTRVISGSAGAVHAQKADALFWRVLTHF